MCLEDIRGKTQRIIGIKGGDYLLTAFVGTNSLRGSKGIYTVAVDEKTADMEIVSSLAAENSAYLCLDENHEHLYATIESDSYHGINGGGVAAYQIGEADIWKASLLCGCGRWVFICS